MTDVQLRVYDPTNTTFIGTLTNAFNRSFVDAHNDHGAGSFSIDLDDPQLSMIQPRRVIRWRIDGEDRFASYVDDRPRTIYDQGEQPAVSVEGPGLAGWLGPGKGGAIVWPVYTGRTRATKRWFGWPSHGFSTDHWNNAVSAAGQQRKPATSLHRLIGEPRDWPDGRAEWLFSHHATQAGGRVFHEDTHLLLKRNLPGIPEGPARIYVAGTTWKLHYDGERIGDGAGFRNMETFDVHIPHNAPTPIAFEVEHEHVPEFQASVGLIMFTMRRLNSEGEPRGTIFRTFTPGVYGSGTAQWRVLRNPDPIPGVTPGRVLRTLIDEPKDRGALAGLTYDFTFDEDSNGESWEIDTINEGFDIGTKLYVVLQRLEQDYGLDWHVTPTGTLRVFNARGLLRSGTLGPFARGTASGEGVRATRLLGATTSGFRSSDSDPLGVGIVEDYVELGGVDRLGALPHLQRRLATAARESDEFDFELSDSSPSPYADFDNGDEFEDGRVTQIAMTQDDDAGGVRWAVSLRPTG